MEKEQTQNELKTSLIHLKRNGNELEVHLEGSIEDWLILLSKVAITTPQFKRAIVLTAAFFEFEKQQND